MAVIDIEYGREILEREAGEDPSSNEVKEALELEMVLQNSSYGHEYARIELEAVTDYIQQEELISKMENFKRAYFRARRYLKRHNPERLQKIESELLDQKVRIFGGYTA
jgi:hypothetical protein